MGFIIWKQSLQHLPLLLQNPNVATKQQSLSAVHACCAFVARLPQHGVPSSYHARLDGAQCNVRCTRVVVDRRNGCSQHILRFQTLIPILRCAKWRDVQTPRELPRVRRQTGPGLENSRFR
ncbi:hypothetical protein Acr_23g0006180 [Actinidia rufa]|uniref:Uncharacterized protein n=1 Tax=Actinidia rufa TaxID=165716 RepID=A0A7J0GN50_9ERIC|nr:hypothetical protein Acr_23g0006180 [Actinidia rufa]